MNPYTYICIHKCKYVEVNLYTAHSREDETRNGHQNAKRNPEHICVSSHMCASGSFVGFDRLCVLACVSWSCVCLDHVCVFDHVCVLIICASGSFWVFSHVCVCGHLCVLIICVSWLFVRLDHMCVFDHLCVLFILSVLACVSRLCVCLRSFVSLAHLCVLINLSVLACVTRCMSWWASSNGLPRQTSHVSHGL